MIEFWDAIWSILVELSVWLFVGAFVSVLMYRYLPDTFIKGKMQGYGGVLRSVILGVPLPLCSCGVIPAGISLKKNGASSGSAVGFLISTPQTGVDSVLVSSAFLGWPFAIFKVFAAAIMGIIGGFLVEGFEQDTKKQIANVSESPEKDKTWKDSWDHGVQLIRGIWKWLIVGIVLSAMLDVWVPDSFLSSVGTGFISSLAALLISIPLYVCATASVPIAASLVAAGFPPAAALVFLVAGPATNVATIGAIFSAFGKRTTIIYVSTVVIGSLILGSLFSFVIPIANVASPHVHHEWWMEIFAVALVGLLLFFAYEEFQQKRQLQHMQHIIAKNKEKNKEKNQEKNDQQELENQEQENQEQENQEQENQEKSISENTSAVLDMSSTVHEHAELQELQLQGIHCGGCVSKITKDLNEHFRFEQISIDREQEVLFFAGNVDVQAMKERIRSLGFGVYEIKTLRIEGLHCGGCVSKLKKSFEGTVGIDEVVVSLQDHTAICKTVLSDQELEEVVHNAGFSLLH